MSNPNLTGLNYFSAPTPQMGTVGNAGINTSAMMNQAAFNNTGYGSAVGMQAPTSNVAPLNFDVGSSYQAPAFGQVDFQNQANTSNQYFSPQSTNPKGTALGMNTQTLGLGINAVNSLGNLYFTNKALGIQNEQLDLAKRQLGNTETSYNQQVNDRARQLAALRYGSSDSPEAQTFQQAYAAENGIK